MIDSPQLNALFGNVNLRNWLKERDKENIEAMSILQAAAISATIIYFENSSNASVHSSDIFLMKAMWSYVCPVTF